MEQQHSAGPPPGYSLALPDVGHGPRRLWTETGRPHTRRCSLRHPSIDRFGLTAQDSGTVAYWFDDPTRPVGGPAT